MIHYKVLESMMTYTEFYDFILTHKKYAPLDINDIVDDYTWMLGSEPTSDNSEIRTILKNGKTFDSSKHVKLHIYLKYSKEYLKLIDDIEKCKDGDDALSILKKVKEILL